MKIRFRVLGLPPRKDGASSMWASAEQARRLVDLRRAAREAMAGAPPLLRDVHLVLRVHAGPRDRAVVGDLDNLIGGVCDGLMAAPRRVRPHPYFADPACAEIAPCRCIAIVDDEAIVRIEAEKRFDAPDGAWYEIVLESARPGRDVQS